MNVKNLKVLLGFVCILGFAIATLPAEAANKKSHNTTVSKTTKKSTRSTSRKSSAKPAAKSANSASAGEKICKNVRVKTAKGYRTQRRCTIDSSPLKGGALDSGKAPELKARTIPDRAYAVDGYTFFHQGRKYRILGINEELIPAGNDLAKQRLQMALDSGQVSVEPESIDDNGTVRALVRVGGKNLADVLNASN